jgi:hypothetical protein
MSSSVLYTWTDDDILACAVALLAVMLTLAYLSLRRPRRQSFADALKPVLSDTADDQFPPHFIQSVWFFPRQQAQAPVGGTTKTAAKVTIAAPQSMPNTPSAPPRRPSPAVNVADEKEGDVPAPLSLTSTPTLSECDSSDYTPFATFPLQDDDSRNAERPVLPDYMPKTGPEMKKWYRICYFV